MHTNFRPFLLMLTAVTLSAGAPPAPAPATDPGWPRDYSEGSVTLRIYQPQIDTWKEFRRLEGRFAVAITPSKSSSTFYGAVRVQADSDVDIESRVVTVTNFTLAEVVYPSARDEAEAASLKTLTEKLFPKRPTYVALARVLAYMDARWIKVQQTAVSLEPPPILVATQPAVLVIVDGEPVYLEIDGTRLRKVVNTNWDLFFDQSGDRFYLRHDRGWLTAKELTGAWSSVKELPKDFAKLPATEPYKEVRETAAKPQKQPPLLVLVAHKPTELIVVNGAPVMQRVADRQLMWIANTDSDLFYDPIGRYYYFLTSGRWFRNAELRSGNWVSATTLLPSDFQRIPASHPRAQVLASVPGTREAEDAVLTASLPRIAKIDRKTAKAEVQYVGEPEFKTIAGTRISYAVNTPNDVLNVGDEYYLCFEGVWFVAPEAKGPWTAADRIPEEIYAIPPESSKHNVTYVNIYDATADTIDYGYTAGYTGVYVGYGVAMWGTGYYYPPYYGWGAYGYPAYWPAAYYTYGASAWYNPATGAYARGSAVYGPYGGYGRAAAYSPSTGRYSWGRAAWGPYGAAASGGFYNPNTGTWGGSYRASNGYQSWGQSVVGRGDQLARTVSYSDSRGTVGAAKTSAGGAAIAKRGNDGQGFVARSGAGDVYAGRDGNVYRRDGTGSWSQYTGSWQSLDRPTPKENPASREQARAATQDLNRDAAARSRGNYNTERSSTRQSGSFSSGRSFGGGGFASRGGGRRR